MGKLLTEVIGTFFLVLTIGLTVAQGVPLAPLAIGGVLMVMVYMGAHISGAKYNPAVSLAVMLRGLQTAPQMLQEWVAQLVGGVLGAVVAGLLTGKQVPINPGALVGAGTAVAVEVLYTFALALVVLNVATHPKTEGKGFYGLAIGFTIVAAAFAGGGISGGAYNPAVGTALTVTGGTGFGNLWIYWVGPLVGGALASAVYSVQVKE